MANNVPRQPPSPGPPQHQGANGIGGAIGNTNGFPLAGQQSDMNHVWGIVQQLSDSLAENRAHTAQLVSSMRQIQVRAAEEGVSPTVAQVNGELNASRAAEIASLQDQITAQGRQMRKSDSEAEMWRSLVDDYENAVTMVLEKLRPYAYSYTQSTVALHAHYNKLLEVERQANLDLRLEHQDWQARLLKLSELVRLAHKETSEGTLPYAQKIAALKSENQVLRRLAGWSEASDSSDEELDSDSRYGASHANV